MDTVKPQLLIAGYGDLGSRVAQLAIRQGMDVVGLCRSARPAAENMRLLSCDVTQPSSLTPLAGMSPDLLFYCVAADAQTDASYQAHYVDGLKNVLHALKDAPLKHVFFVSSTRVYGQATDSLVDEDAPALPADFGGERLIQAEQLALAHPAPATVLRLSGIYGPGRFRMLKLARQPWDSWPQNSWTNRIHVEDAAGFIAHLLNMRLNEVRLRPCYIVTDSRPAPMHEVLRWVAQKMDQPCPPDAPAVSGGKRLDNRELLATGYALRYPSFEEGYTQLLRASAGTA